GCRTGAPRSKDSGRRRRRVRRRRRSGRAGGAGRAGGDRQEGEMKRLFVAFVIAALSGGAMVAQETRSSTLLTTEHYMNWERVSDAQISPDGSRIVYTRQAVNQIEDKWESSLWILNADGSQHRFLVKGSAARWSPDGKRLLYLSDGEPKGAQLFVRWVDVDGPA